MLSKHELLKLYIPIWAIALLSPTYLTILWFGKYDIPIVTPFEDVGIGSLANFLIFLVITLIFGFLMLYMLKWPKLLRIISIIFIIYLSLITSLLYFDAIIIYFNLIMFRYISILLSISLAILILFSIIKSKVNLYSMLMLNILIGVGVIFNESLPVLTKIVMLIGYSVFDYISVTRGFLKKMFTEADASPTLNLFLIRIGNIGLGAGDIIFYSLLISFSIEYYLPEALLGYIIALIAIILGHLINILLLNRFKMLPALPIPILLGTSLLILIKYI